MDSFTIRVKTLAPATHDVSVSPTTTVAALKQVVATLTGVPAHRQRLIFRGRVVNDGQTIQEAGELGGGAREEREDAAPRRCNAIATQRMHAAAALARARDVAVCRCFRRTNLLTASPAHHPIYTTPHRPLRQ